MVYIAIIILTYLAKKLAASHLDANEICQSEERPNPNFSQPQKSN